MDFKTKLISLRKEHELSQDDLSTVTSIPVKRIKLFELGTCFPSINELQTLAIYYNLPIEDFYRFPEANDNYSRYFDLKKMSTIKLIWYPLFILFMTIPWQTVKGVPTFIEGDSGIEVIETVSHVSGVTVDQNKYVIIGVLIIAFDLLYNIFVRAFIDKIGNVQLHYIIDKTTKFIGIFAAFVCVAYVYGLSSLALI